MHYPFLTIREPHWDFTKKFAAKRLKWVFFSKIDFETRHDPARRLMWSYRAHQWMFPIYLWASYTHHVFISFNVASVEIREKQVLWTWESTRNWNFSIISKYLPKFYANSLLIYRKTILCWIHGWKMPMMFWSVLCFFPSFVCFRISPWENLRHIGREHNIRESDPIASQLSHKISVVTINWVCL